MKKLKGIWLGLMVFALGSGSAALVRGRAPDAADEPATNSVAVKTRVAAEADDTISNSPTVITNEESEPASKHKRGIHREAIVVMGRDVELKKGDSAEAVVVIGGSAKIHGNVDNAVVVIGGDILVDGEIGDAAVAIMGNLKALKGAQIHGETVTVGGRIDNAEGVVIHGNPVEIDPGGVGIALRKWFVHCVLKLRPLAPQVGFVWLIAGFFFVIYFLVALILPRPVQACVAELTRRPVTTFFLGLLTKLLVPVVVVILIATGIGVLVAPFIIAALMFGVIVGKVALLECLGLGLGRRFGATLLPLGAFLIGIAVLTLLYMVPVLGLMTFGVVSVWGLGAAVTATFGSLRREMPERPPPPPSPGAPVLPTASPGSEPAPGTGIGMAGSAQPSGSAPMPAVSGPGVALPETLAFPKAGFWERMGAAFLDVLLVGIVGSVIGRPPLGFLLTLAYFVAMWTWKGTTVGGVVLGLKVVRLDGQPVTLTVALVRALAGAFSVIVFFLGILWIAWDRDKQGWHDRIAGTVVIRMPRGTPLVCF